jgi:hypothetical protein
LYLKIGLTSRGFILLLSFSEEEGGMGEIVVPCRKLGEENWHFGKII